MFEQAICSIIENPAGNKTATDSQKCRENENKMMLTPNPRAGNRNPTAQSLYPGLGGQSQRAQQSAHAGRSDENAESTRPAVQDLIGENRHETRCKACPPG